NLPPTSPQTNPLLTLIQQRQALLKEINDPTFNEFETVNPQLPDFSQLLTPTTAFLAVRFHEELTPTRTIPQALKAAQTWFRTRTVPQFLQWCEQTFQIDPDDLDRYALRFARRYSRSYPFAKRLYWAAFRVNGLE
ncbi:hypothetical protein K4A83_20355, partial [Spirulina subsalsa FACHB-351]|nr:hypothetical protein [Spirulina subsalsa FACHB-351]